MLDCAGLVLDCSDPNLGGRAKEGARVRSNIKSGPAISYAIEYSCDSNIPQFSCLCQYGAMLLAESRFGTSDFK